MFTPGFQAAGADKVSASLPWAPGAPHLELGLGDLSALLHIQRGESVPDGFKQLLAQGHG